MCILQPSLGDRCSGGMEEISQSYEPRCHRDRCSRSEGREWSFTHSQTRQFQVVFSTLGASGKLFHKVHNSSLFYINITIEYSYIVILIAKLNISIITSQTYFNSLLAQPKFAMPVKSLRWTQTSVWWHWRHQTLHSVGTLQWMKLLNTLQTLLTLQKLCWPKRLWLLFK